MSPLYDFYKADEQLMELERMRDEEERDKMRREREQRQKELETLTKRADNVEECSRDNKHTSPPPSN